MHAKRDIVSMAWKYGRIKNRNLRILIKKVRCAMIGDKKNNPNKVSNSYDNCSCDKDKPKKDCDCSKYYEVEPLPESSRPRKDGPGGN